MMKGVIIFLFYSGLFYCQQGQQRLNDNSKIYEKLLLVYKDNNIIIQPQTSIKTIKRFNFKDPGSHELKASWALTKDWRGFLNNVDTLNLHTGSIKKYIRNMEAYTGKKLKKLIFSPIILSADKRKAICAVSIYGSPEDASEQVFLLEKTGNKWMIVKYYMLSIS